jgi:peptidoglycan/xylan/chitin deacetylase (PgdA/CDA1 family)
MTVERYALSTTTTVRKVLDNMSINGEKFVLNFYYSFKPFLTRRAQICLRRYMYLLKRRMYGNIWPIDTEAGKTPSGWSGWPDNKQFALILTHDVEKAGGVEKCLQLMKLEADMGFRSSFNFVSGDYQVEPKLRQKLTDNGFEVGVHGWTHDGSLYRSRKTFMEQALKINKLLKEWSAVGFRSPSMHHNLEWLRDLDIEYDMSTFDTDPFEPQSDGVKTIFPFYVEDTYNQKGYVELPYTLPQDFTVFVLMRKSNIEIWKKKLDWISRKGGMALINTHPDYMQFDGKQPGYDQYPAEMYEAFLRHVHNEYDNLYWHVLPKEIARFWAGGAKTEGEEKEWPKILPRLLEKKTSLRSCFSPD